MRRHHEHTGEAAVGKPLKHARRLEAGRDLHEAAEVQRGHREGETSAVRHRRQRQKPVIRSVAAVLHRHGMEGQCTRAMGDQDSRGLTGRAGAVHECERTGLRDLRQLIDGQRLDRHHPAFAGFADDKQTLHRTGGQHGNCLLGKREQGRVDDQQTRSAVAACRYYLGSGTARIERRDDQSHVT